MKPETLLAAMKCAKPAAYNSRYEDFIVIRNKVRTRLPTRRVFGRQSFQKSFQTGSTRIVSEKPRHNSLL
jgi:hypothetical protein